MKLQAITDTYRFRLREMTIASFAFAWHMLGSKIE